MGKYSGLTAKTFERLIIDSGVVYKNYGIPVRTITLNTVIATDAVIVNGVTLTGVAADPDENQFVIGENDTETATNLAALISTLDGVTAIAEGNVITVTGDTALTKLEVTTSDTTMTIGSNGLNSELIGATRDGAVFNVTGEQRDIPVDGAHGKVKGLERITRVEAKISAKFIEITPDLIKMALPGSTVKDYPSDASPTHDEIRRALSIALTDYIDNVVIIGEVSGSDEPVICGIENALATGGFELTTADQDEAGIPIELAAHFDPSDLINEPWFIRYPQDV